MAGTVMDVLASSAREHGPRAALRAKRGGTWKSWSWTEYETEVRLMARGFLALGLQPGKGVVIMGYNRPEWFIADVAAIAAGGVPTGIYTTNTHEQIRYITEHCEASIAVVENRAYLEIF